MAIVDAEGPVRRLLEHPEWREVLATSAVVLALVQFCLKSKLAAFAEGLEAQSGEEKQ